MKLDIERAITKTQFKQTNSSEIYIVDYKNSNNGNVELHETEPSDIKCVCLLNKNEIPILFYGFLDNALELSTGIYSQQCECVLFPASDDDNDWVLFIECKYSNDLKSATDVKNGYPQKMITQIIKTITYFREAGILNNNKRATAIVSFPNLINEFNSTFFTGEYNEMDILKNYNVLIRATNSATIISSKRISFRTD